MKNILIKKSHFESTFFFKFILPLKSKPNISPVWLIGYIFNDWI